MMDSAVVAQHFADSAFCRQYGYDTATMACLFIPTRMKYIGIQVWRIS